MTLLDWLQQTPNAHLVGECFEVRSDLVGASESLGARAHLLPMSDSTLLNVGLGITLNGDCAVVEWPSDDVSSIAAWIQHLPDSGVGPLVVRVQVGKVGIDLNAFPIHPAVEVWAVASDAQRTEVLQRALTQRHTVVVLESAPSIAWHKLEDSHLDGAVTQHGDTNAHCVLVSTNLDASIVQNAVDSLAEQGVSIRWFEQHNVTQFDSAVLQGIFDVGRVVCVGLPTSWISTLINTAFWRLESEPLFCRADETAIVQAVYSTLES